MPGFPGLLLIATGCSLLALNCNAQALVEYAAGAAVGTAGSVGGKAVSNSLDRIFKKTGATAQRAAGTQPAAKPKREETPPKQLSQGAGSSSAPVRPAARKFARPRVEGAVVSLVESPSALPPTGEAAPAAPAVPAVVATAEEFGRIAPGASRQELLERLGAPAFRVRIQGDGHVQEIYRYSSNGTDLGTVRVVDGAVTAIKVRNN